MCQYVGWVEELHAAYRQKEKACCLWRRASRFSWPQCDASEASTATRRQPASKYRRQQQVYQPVQRKTSKLLESFKAKAHHSILRQQVLCHFLNQIHQKREKRSQQQGKLVCVKLNREQNVRNKRNLPWRISIWEFIKSSKELNW